MRIPQASWVLAALVAAAVAVAPGALAQRGPELAMEVVVRNPDEPWDVAVSQNGDILYSEKCMGLMIQINETDGSGYADPILLFGDPSEDPQLAAPDFFCEGQSGGAGVEFDPDFEDNRYVYFYFASDRAAGGRPAWNHVVRLTMARNLRSVSDRVDIIDDIYFKYKGSPNGGPGSHSGGRIRFGPDGYLYVTTGDNHNATLPQDLNALGGKVLRVDRDGDAAPENDPPRGADPRIFTYGHRNVQGITFQPGTGAVYISEHGPGYDDEVTPLENGGNGGWDPQDRPSLDCPGDYCGYAGTPRTMPMTDYERFPDAMPPAWVYNADTARGISGADFLRGSQWGGWDGQFLVGIMGAMELWRLEFGRNGNTTEEKQLAGNSDGNPFRPTRFRGMRLAPDRSLYVINEAPPQSTIYRVVAGGGMADAPGMGPADTPLVAPNPPADGVTPSDGPAAPDEASPGPAPSDGDGDSSSGAATAATRCGVLLSAAVVMLSAELW